MKERVGKASKKVAEDAIVVVTFIQVGSLVVLQAKLVVRKVKLIRANADDRTCGESIVSKS